MNIASPYALAAIEAGWEKRKYGEAVKWLNPHNDDGARYLDTETSLRHLCEDYDLSPYK